MGKRIDNDATQEVSSSQVVPPAKPPGAPNVPKNDASMWMQSPVNADDFMGGAKKPKKKAAAPGDPGRRAVIGVMVVLFLVTIGLGGYWLFLHEPAKPVAKAPTATTLPPPATPPIATTMVDAAVAVAADAAVTIGADAAVPAGMAALQADAVSAAGPAIKKAKKRPTAKKKTAKKKSATAPKRR